MTKDDEFEAVAVGSGFGSTILALSLVNKFQSDNAKDNTNKKVCVLERGQWWINHELNYTPKEERRTCPNMREFLEENKRPYHYYSSSNKTKVYPDFYVIDGSVFPDTVGVNPSLAIAAIAFRAAEKIVGQEFLPAA